MTRAEKDERIKYLWQKARIVLKQVRFVKSTQDDLEDKFLD